MHSLSPPKLFGTDGIRGKAGRFPVQPHIIMRVGQALGYLLKKNVSTKNPPLVLIGKDTRLSGYMLEQALASGLNSMGIWVELTGPLPSPGIGFLARNMRAQAGVVISASHNQYEDNGIKIFDSSGFKISKKTENEIEELVHSPQVLDKQLARSRNIGRTKRIDDATGRYVVHVKNTLPWGLSLESFRLVLDSSHGACYKVAPAVFRELGAQLVKVIGDNPNGQNINKQTGPLFPGVLQSQVLKHKADVGISVDGDGDRLLMVDETGEVVTGCQLLGICALSLKKQGMLKGLKVATTFMANSGLKESLNKSGITLHFTGVGDRNVVKLMKKEDIVLGGEPSGHMIFLKHGASGDALIAALNVLLVMLREKKPLSQLKQKVRVLPRVETQVKLRGQKKPDLLEIKGFKELLKKCERKLGKAGRVYVRYSGTEPLIRVLVEGEDKKQLTAASSAVSTFLKKAI